MASHQSHRRGQGRRKQYDYKPGRGPKIRNLSPSLLNEPILFPYTKFISCGSGNRQSTTDVDESSAVIKVFREFQKELDLKNDKHERIVKLSRDITIESKRLIFLLHRINGSCNQSEILKDAENKLQEIHCSKFLPLADELKGQDSYQFLRAFSPGLQEYIEAVTFYYFLKDNELVGVDKIQADIHAALNDTSKKDGGSVKTTTADPATSDSVEPELQASVTGTPDESKPHEVPIPLTEYMLGIADFTGELMRMAINSVGAGDLETPKEVTDLMRTIHNAFSSFSNAPRELRRKATVLRQSLQKVENACYNLRVRGSEIPKHMLADIFSASHSSMPDDSYIGDTEEIMS